MTEKRRALKKKHSTMDIVKQGHEFQATENMFR